MNGASIKSRLGTRLALIKATTGCQEEFVHPRKYPIENLHAHINTLIVIPKVDPWHVEAFAERSIDYSAQFYERIRRVDMLIDVTSPALRYDCWIASSSDICERRPMNLGQFGNCLEWLHVIVTGNWNRYN